MTLLPNLQARFRQALAAFTDRPEPWLEMIRRSQDARFGDYQANFAMALGKQLNKKPQELAAEVVARLDVADLCQPPEVAGPGFINLRSERRLARRAAYGGGQRSAAGRRAGREPRTYVIDYSAPNVAKPMHVGHIRSTVIGDALCRTLRFLGHRVDQRQPHRRLGHAVRHDHLRLQALSGAGRLSQSARAGTGPALSPRAAVGRLLRGPGEVCRSSSEQAGREAAGPGSPSGRPPRRRRQKADKKLREAVRSWRTRSRKLARKLRAPRRRSPPSDADPDPCPTGGRASADRPRLQAETAKLPCRRRREPAALAGVHALLPGRHPADLPPPGRPLRSHAGRELSITTCCRAWSRSCVAGALPARARGPSACSWKASRRR